MKMYKFYFVYSSSQKAIFPEEHRLSSSKTSISSAKSNPQISSSVRNIYQASQNLNQRRHSNVTQSLSLSVKDSIEKERRGSIWKTAVYGRDEGSLVKALHVTRTQSLLPMDLTSKMGISNNSIAKDIDYKRAKKADNFLKHNIKHLTKYDPDHHTCARFIWYDTLPIRVGTRSDVLTKIFPSGSTASVLYLLYRTCFTSSKYVEISNDVFLSIVAYLLFSGVRPRMVVVHLQI